MLKKSLYILIYFLLANSLFGSISRMASASMGVETQSSNPYLEIVFVGVCLLFCLLTYNKKRIPINGKRLIFFLSYVFFISIFHGLIIGFGRDIAVFLYVQPLMLFFVEYYAQQDDIVRKLTSLLVKALTCWIVSLFIINYLAVLTVRQDQFIRTNTSYYLLYFIPMLFLFINEKYRKYVFLIVLLVVLFSIKRGGLVSLSLGFLSYIFIDGMINNKKGIVRVAIMSLFFCFAIIWTNDYMGDILYDRFNILTEDQGNGRSDLWEIVWLQIKEADFLHALFGHGFDTVVKNSGTGYSAHNDYIEVIYDFGWIGFILFLGFIVSWFIYAIKLTKKRIEYAPVIMMTMTIFVTSCFFSHIVIYTLSFNLFSLFYGASLGIERRNKKINSIVQ